MVAVAFGLSVFMILSPGLSCCQELIYPQGELGKFKPQKPVKKNTRKKEVKTLHEDYFKFHDIPSGYIVKKVPFQLKCTFRRPDASRYQIIVNDDKFYRGNILEKSFSRFIDLSLDNNGVNTIDVAVAGKEGVLGWTRFKLLYLLSAEEKMMELGKIEFTSPPYGYRLGRFEWYLVVEGKVDVPDVKKSELYINGKAREIKLENGLFREKIFTLWKDKILLKIKVEDIFGRKMFSTYHIINGR